MANNMREECHHRLKLFALRFIPSCENNDCIISELITAIKTTAITMWNR